MGFTEKRFNIERLYRMPEEAVMEIVEASWQHWNSIGACEQKSVAEWREYLRFEDRELPRLHFGVSWNSRVVAMASIVEMDYPPVDDEKMTPWLANLFVLPEFRGKGLTDLLRGQRISALRQLGWSEVYVLADRDNDVLHEKNGFVMVDPARRIMRRDLRK